MLSAQLPAILRNMSHEMPVTTKAQPSAESEDCVNSLKSRRHEFPSKTEKSANYREILECLLTPTCGALLLYESKDEATRGGGL